MKRIISILMSITVILSMMPALAFATDGDSTGSSTSSEATDVKTPAESTDVANNGESDKAIDESTVASINDGNNVKCYKTLTKAISDASNVEATDSNQSSRTIILQKNVEEDITVSKNAITLDLNGKTLTNKSNDTITINKNAKLTVVGNGTVDNVSHGKAAVYNSGEAVLLGGTYTRSEETGSNVNTSGGNSYYNILNHGGMHIGKGVTVSQTGKFSSLIDNGYYNYDSNNPRSGYVQGVNFEKPELTIDGATFSGGLNTIKNDDEGILTINDGKFSNYSQNVVQNHNVAVINNGTFASDGTEDANVRNCGCGKHDAGQLTINGGTFTGGKVAIQDVSNKTEAPDAFVIVNGGSFTGEVTTVDCSKFINAGSFSVNPDKNYIADGKNVYLKNDKNYYVAAEAPANSTGMNAWAKGEDGIYTETYVAPAPTPEPEKNPITNSGSSTAGDSTTKLDASDNTTTTDGKTETKIDTELGGKVVDNAVENKSTDVKIDAATAKGDSTESNVVLPATTVKDISDKTQASITVNTDNASVSLDKKAVDAVAEKAGTTGDVKLVVQTKEVKDNKVVVELKIETANGEVHDFKGGIATVTVPVHKDMKDKELVAVYIDENGKYIILDGKKNADGTFTFTTGHFSTYAVMTKADADAAVEAQKIENAEVSGIVAKTYTGKAITQDVVVTLGDKTLAAGTDYEVTYENNVKVGLASVKIAGKGKYEGEITKTFKINPKSVALTSVKAQNKALKATWKKSANKVTGYQVRYSTSSKFKTYKTVSVKYTKKINSKVVKNLKSNKRYYVKVRTYTKTADGTYYSVWSKAKSAKVK